LTEISVIIPALNEGKRIEGCLKSLRKQSFKDYEIIVADGKSTDNTVSIAKKYADKVISSKDRGVSEGRNRGEKIAKGKILLFVDADTILSPSMLLTISELITNKNIIGATAQIKPLEKSATIDKIGFKFYNFFVKLSLFIPTMTPQITGICLCIRKDVFDKIGGFNVNMKTCEDLDLCEKAKKYGKFLYLNDSFVKTSMRRMRKWSRLKFTVYHTISLINYALFKRGRVSYEKIN